MNLPNFKNDLELAAYAVANPGYRIRRKDWPKNEYIFWGVFNWVSQDHEEFEPSHFDFYNTQDHEPYAEPAPKPMRKWYWPEFILHEGHTTPQRCKTVSAYESKEEFLRRNSDIKVLEWIEREWLEDFE